MGPGCSPCAAGFGSQKGDPGGQWDDEGQALTPLGCPQQGTAVHWKLGMSLLWNSCWWAWSRLDGTTGWHMAVLGGHTSSVSAVTLYPECGQRGSDDPGGNIWDPPPRGWPHGTSCPRAAQPTSRCHTFQVGFFFCVIALNN